MLDDNFLERMKIKAHRPSEDDKVTSAERVLAILGRKGLERIGERVLRFRTVPMPENDLTIGSSKMGWSPDLPTEIPWPTWDGRPLDFLLQLDLTEIPRKWGADALPESGWIYFFYDFERSSWGFDVSHRYGWRVLFYDGERKNLERGKRPDDADPELRSCGLTFCEVVYVNWPSLNDEQSRTDLRSLTNKGLFEAQVADSGHQILGRTHGCQSMYEEMQENCQLASNGIYLGGGGGPVFDRVKAEQFKPGMKDWRLLLELRSDDNAGLEWTGYGTLYFWIREDDLRNSDFHNVWSIVQCT